MPFVGVVVPMRTVSYVLPCFRANDLVLDMWSAQVCMRIINKSTFFSLALCTFLEFMCGPFPGRTLFCGLVCTEVCFS